MRFSYAESMTDPSFYAPLARAAEEAGYDSMVVPDSICYPRHAVSRYPYSPDGSRDTCVTNDPDLAEALAPLKRLWRDPESRLEQAVKLELAS